RAEGRPDDDPDGEIDDASLEREFLEFLEHGTLPEQPQHGRATRAAAQINVNNKPACDRGHPVRMAMQALTGCACCKAGSSSSLRSATSGCCSSSRATATGCARAAAAPGCAR